MFGREKIAMVLAEFIGTFTLASVVLAMIGRTNFPFFAAAAAAAAVALMTLVIGEISGAHLNPAITIGQWTLRKIETGRAIVFIAAQMLGGVVAWTLNEYLLNQSLKNIANASFDWRVLIAEAVGATVFSMGVAAAIYKGYKGLELALTVGASLFVGILIASFGSNGILNPAVAVGVQSWSFVYATGPIIGAIIGMNLYNLVFAPRPVKVQAVTAKKASASKKRK